MPEITSTTRLKEYPECEIEQDDRETIIDIDHVSMVFNMASEKLTNLKEYFIAIMKRRLFFEGFSALDDIDFEVKKGDVFGILGTNGSGKSTLLKIVAGVLAPTSGKSTVKGNIAPLIELGAGFDVELSAQENIYLNGALLGYTKDFIDEHFDEIVDFAEIEKFLDMPLKNYSSGMIARIAFSIATVMIPDVLIVDEVLSVGDFMFQKKCEDRISELINKHGVTVLIVSHSNDQIERLCNKAIWIEKGHTRIQGTAKEVCDAYRVLGGREVSPDSEALIFDVLQKAENDEFSSKQTRYISGDDHYSIAIQLAWDAWKGEDIENIVMVPDYSHAFSISASGIAGALKAPILPFNCEDPTGSIEKIASSLNPKKAFIFAYEETVDQVMQNDYVVSLFNETIPLSLQRSTFNLKYDPMVIGNALHAWDNSSEAIIVHFNDNAEAFSIAPYAYKNLIPILMVFDDDSTIDSRIEKILHDIDVDTIIGVGSITQTDMFKHLGQQGFKIFEGLESLGSFDHYGTQWPPASFDQSKILLGPRSNSHWQDLINSSAYSAKKSIPLILEDTSDLDDVANCLKYSSENKVSDITAIGRNNFSQIDMKLLLEAGKVGLPPQ